jgi:hypothetical protein
MPDDHTLTDDSSPCAIETWWASRRLRYNVGLVVAGVLGFICYAAAIQRCIDLHSQGDFEITIFTIVFQACAYLVMIGIANVCYCLGPWSERRLRPRNAARYRKIAFRLGFWFSVLLPFTPSALLVLSCSPHAGEQTKIILELVNIAGMR